MAGIYDKYGIDCEDLDTARALVGKAIPVEFVLHESLFWGGDYYLAQSREFGRISIRPNFNRFTGKLGEADFPGYRFVIAVSKPADPDALKDRLTAGGLSFLRRTVVEDAGTVRKGSREPS